LKAQYVSRGTPLIIRSSKLYLQPLVYIPMWWPVVAKATWQLWINKFYYKAASCCYFYWGIYDARIHEYEISLKSDKSNGYFTWRPIYIFYHISLNFSWNEKYFRQICRQNHSTFHSPTFFPPENHAIYENVEKYCRVRQATDNNTAHAHYMVGTLSHIHTLRICNTYCYSTATMVARTGINITLYIHCLSCLHQSLFSVHFCALKNSIFSLKGRSNRSSITEVKCRQYNCLCYAFNAATCFDIKGSSSDKW